MNKRKHIWITEGYAELAKNGPMEIKVDKLALKLNRSRSS